MSLPIAANEQHKTIMGKKNYTSEKQQIGTGCSLKKKYIYIYIYIHTTGRTDSYHMWSTLNMWHICWYAYVLYYYCHYMFHIMFQWLHCSCQSAPWNDV